MAKSSQSTSSKRWLKEHFDDPYVKEAQKKGYRSRAVFKLIEIQEKYKIIKPGKNIVDLGAAPGSWSQIASKWLAGRGPASRNHTSQGLRRAGQIFALDILPMEPLEGVTFIQGDFQENEVLDKILATIGDTPIDLVLSDMAPNITGNAAIDIPKAMYLSELALEMAQKVLRPGGTFLVKVLQGIGYDAYLSGVRNAFKQVKVCKPKASRARSREVYILAREFKSVF